MAHKMRALLGLAICSPGLEPHSRASPDVIVDFDAIINRRYSISLILIMYRFINLLNDTLHFHIYLFEGNINFKPRYHKM